MRKRFLSLVLVALGLAPLGLPQTAGAAVPVDLTCPISVTAKISPGLTLTTQPQQVTGDIKVGSSIGGGMPPCTSLSGTVYQGGAGQITGGGQQDCLLRGGLGGTIAFTWDNGDTSTITWSTKVVLFIPIVSATVTGGALQGATLLAIGIPTGFTGTCALSPLKGLGLIGIASTLG